MRGVEHEAGRSAIETNTAFRVVPRSSIAPAMKMSISPVAINVAVSMLAGM